MTLITATCILYTSFLSLLFLPYFLYFFLALPSLRILTLFPPPRRLHFISLVPPPFRLLNFMVSFSSSFYSSFHSILYFIIMLSALLPYIFSPLPPFLCRPFYYHVILFIFSSSVLLPPFISSSLPLPFPPSSHLVWCTQLFGAPGQDAAHLEDMCHLVNTA